jgi:chromosome segregation protein
VLQFSKLRIAGFKSFVDPVELLLEPGLTGIVGPNGCGKSNLVEALRWVMGETSARLLRGGEMDDVIFAGSNERASRNIAEVCLELDNSAGTAPPPWSDADELVVSRRIERARGSSFRVNGREVRARDVHLLFADAASGARSAAMVTQGQVSQLIAAKPSERRALLEEAAGVVGLHARRHESEIRLRAAESNLARLDDVLATLDVQRIQLQRQGKQATRYRKVSEQIRILDATILWLRWQAAEQALALAGARLATAEQAVGAATGAAAEAAARQANVAAALPELRRADHAAAMALQALASERQALDNEERTMAREAETARAAGRQLTADLRRDEELASDAAATCSRLAAERQRLTERQAGEGDERASAEAALSEAAARAAALEDKAAVLANRLAAVRGLAAGLSRSRQEAAARLKRAEERHAEAERRREAALEDLKRLPQPAPAEAEVAAAEVEADAARGALQQAEAEYARRAAEETTTAAQLRDAEMQVARLSAEEAALAETLAATGTDEQADGAVLDMLTVPEGLETALAAALGDDLLAGCDEAASSHWRALVRYDEPPPLPDGASLLDLGEEEAPAVLGRRLDQIGLVADRADGARLQPALLPGQRLVSRDGDLWRWDGFIRRADAPSPAAVRLRQRARLQALGPQQQVAFEALKAAGRLHEASRSAAGAVKIVEQHERNRVRSAEAALRAAGDALGKLRASRLALEQRLVDADGALAATTPEIEEARTRLAAIDAEIAALPADAPDASALETIRTELGRARRTESDCRAHHDSLLRETAGRARRLQLLVTEIEAWNGRLVIARTQLSERQISLRQNETELARLETLPLQLARRQRELLDRLERTEADRRKAADRVVAAETALAEADRSLRMAEREVGQAREECVRAESERAQAESALAILAHSIVERLGVQPRIIPEIIGTLPSPDLDIAAEEHRLERLRRERELIGPVNLRAEAEELELRGQIEGLNTERDDVQVAVAKLRRGIAELDREGRDRLRAAFADIDHHFQELFVRLFGGGHAHLALVDAEDPLQAGLEVMARPPGKKLQLMSLLSGGEQALTALALRFALFLGRPIPMCVLDEVDAALDDANVDRFCSLLSELSGAGTRFLVVTHHRLTMARMHRLFGVTMIERGISRLVSVELGSTTLARRSA